MSRKKGLERPLLVDEESFTGVNASMDERPSETLAEKVRRHLVLLLMVLLVVIGVANNCLSKRMYNSFGRYAFFCNQAVNLLYLFLSLVCLAYKVLFTNDITPGQWRFPKRKFFFMACFDAFAGFLAAVSSADTPGQVQTLLNQLVIPTTMISAFLFLGTRFPAGQCAGAVIVLIGACVAIVPSLVSGGGSDADVQMKWYAVTIYFASNIPTAFSSVYKEAAFNEPTTESEGAHDALPGDADVSHPSLLSSSALGGSDDVLVEGGSAGNTGPAKDSNGDDLDVFLLTAFVTTFQLIVGFALVPLLAVPGFSGVPLKDIPANLKDGWSCLEGNSPRDDDWCNEAPTALALYVAVNFAFNLCNLVVTKHASAALTAVAYSVRLPIVNIAYTIHPVMGRWTESFSGWSIAGLVVTLAGFTLYQYAAPKDEDEVDHYVEAFTALPPQSAGFELKGRKEDGHTFRHEDSFVLINESDPINIGKKEVRKRRGGGRTDGPYLMSAPN